jgi:hypothetical protein
MQIVTESWNNLVRGPWIVYMPEKDRLLMLISFGQAPHHAMILTSNDHGDTWSEPRYVHTNAAGEPDAVYGLGLTYLGKGKLFLREGDTRWFSSDYGETWANPQQVPSGPNGAPRYQWDPALVDKDPVSGEVKQIIEATWSPLVSWHTLGPDDGPYEQGYIRFSYDEGRSWKNEIKVPQWLAVNEVALIRAMNGDIVAGCRTGLPKRFMCGNYETPDLDCFIKHGGSIPEDKNWTFRGKTDGYCGLGVSISKDNGKTWSELHRLFEWGRQFPSMITLPNGDMVMSYAVRFGYVETEDGYRQSGIEAVVSHDNGRTWDLDHRYILAAWKAILKGANCRCQCTSSVLLPDGSILTGFGSGYRNEGPVYTGPMGKDLWDIVLVRWRVNNTGLNSDKKISKIPYDSNIRNIFDPQIYHHKKGEMK